MNSLYFDKMHMLYNQNKSCVKSCQNTLLLKNTHCFPKNPIVFQHVHFFIPLFWNEKLSLVSAYYKVSFIIKLTAITTVGRGGLCASREYQVLFSVFLWKNMCKKVGFVNNLKYCCTQTPSTNKTILSHKQSAILHVMCVYMPLRKPWFLGTVLFYLKI